MNKYLCWEKNHKNSEKLIQSISGYVRGMECALGFRDISLFKKNGYN